MNENSPPSATGSDSTTVARASSHDGVGELIAAIQSTDDAVRGKALQSSATAGSRAVPLLGALLTHTHFEVARSARRALYRIVRHAGRPGAEIESKAVSGELVRLLANDSVTIRREALWLLSEIGDESAIAPMADQLKDAALREDARCALMRLPGKKATDALQSAFADAPEDFKFALAESLRARGVRVEGYPSAKRRPAREAAAKSL